MKKLFFLGIGSALIFTMGGVGSAQADTSGGTHKSTARTAMTADYSIATAGAGRCAGCHRTHTAKGALLLKLAQPALCYSCHGSAALSSDTDVQNGLDANAGLGLRGGGFDYALIGASEATKTLGALDTATGRIAHSAKVPALAEAAAEATTSKHQIDGVTSGTMWGNGAISANIADVGKAEVTLECGSCHDPHGNGNYRILKPIPNDAESKAVAAKAAVAAVTAVADDPLTLTIDETVVGVVGSPAVAAVAAVVVVPVNIPDVPAAVARTYTTTDYWTVFDRTVPLVKGSSVAPLATETDGYIANASQWCSTCHTRYMAKAPDYSTNSGDANFTYRHTSGRTDKVGERPNCIQCHVAHGSNAVMTGTAVGLNPGDTPAAAGDSRLLRIDQRGTCVACHNM